MSERRLLARFVYGVGMEVQRGESVGRDEDVAGSRRSVESGGILAIAVGVAVIIGSSIVFGGVPSVVTLTFVPVTWGLFALIPWTHPSDPLRTRQFGFLAILSALVILVGAPALLFIGPANVLAFTGLVLAGRLRSLRLVIAAVATMAVSWISEGSFYSFADPTIAIGPYVALLVALVVMWYFRARRPSQRE